MSSLLPETSPRGVRERIRRGEWTRPTAGLAPGHVQANLVSLPREQAFDFLLFCQRNPRPCPLVEVLEPGCPEPTATAPGADIRTDLPAYNVYREGVLEATVADVRDYWRDDLVTFLLGCSFTFETALSSAGIPLHHVESERNVAMYKTNVATTPAGVFAGPLVVSMRPVPQAKVVKAVQVTSRFPNAHGAPLHIGDPAALGIADLALPDYGDAPVILDGETPLFWACGVTPQAVAVASKPPFMITHAPGHMFITDLRDEDVAAL